MNIYSLLDLETIHAQISVKDKNELIEILVESLKSKIDEKQLGKVLEKVRERESVMSTGVGKGLGIPHCKTDAVSTSLAVFALLDEPLDYDSIDEEPVRMVLLLVSPNTQNNTHIKLLSRISRLMNSGSFREQILSCTTASEILQTFELEEQKYFVS